MKFNSPNLTGISPTLLLANFSLGPQQVPPSYLGKKNTSTQFDIDLCGPILDRCMSCTVVVSCQSFNVLYPICTPFRLSLTRRKNVCAVRRPVINFKLVFSGMKVNQSCLLPSDDVWRLGRIGIRSEEGRPPQNRPNRGRQKSASEVW